MEFNVEYIPIEEDRKSIKAFKRYMCNRYSVNNVNDIDMPVKEYANLLDVFEAGYGAKEQEIIDNLFKEIKEK